MTKQQKEDRTKRVATAIFRKLEKYERENRELKEQVEQYRQVAISFQKAHFNLQNNHTVVEPIIPMQVKQ